MYARKILIKSESLGAFCLQINKKSCKSLKTVNWMMRMFSFSDAIINLTTTQNNLEALHSELIYQGHKTAL